MPRIKSKWELMGENMVIWEGLSDVVQLKK